MPSIRWSKLIILVPGIQDYHLNMGYSLAKAFNRKGVDVKVLSSSQPPDELQSTISRYSPDVIFEINRTRNQHSFSIPRSIKHVSWIQDARLNGKVHCFDPSFGGSDITYTLLPAQNFGLSPEQSPCSLWRILHTGVDIDIFSPIPSRTLERDIAFCGYIPAPINTDEARAHSVLNLNGKTLTFLDIQNHLLEKCSVAIGTHNLLDIQRAILGKINETFGINLDLSHLNEIFQDDSRLIYFDTEIPRIPERANLIDVAAKYGRLEIFGPDNWLLWPQYRSYYRKMVYWQSELARIYQSSLINLHNGAFGMHSRVLECMGAGGAIFVNDNHAEVSGNDIAAHFEAGTHYISYSFENLASQIEYYRNNPDLLKAIGLAAAEEIAAKHQWIHRAEQILGDLNSLQ